MSRADLRAGFIRIQLELVARSVELGGTWRDGVHRLTNLQRRLGLGTPTDPPTGRWAELLARVDALAAVEPVVELVLAEVAELPAPMPEHLRHGWPTVGAFSIQIEGDIARTHFFSTDTDGVSALHPSKAVRRRAELTSVLAEVRAAHPELRRVRGGSWLYALDRYASLFPPAHLATAVERRDRDTFRGMSHWGQFVDHRGELRDDRAEVFRLRVSRWHGGDPCPLFPIPTLELDAPIEVFDGWG